MTDSVVNQYKIMESTANAPFKVGELIDLDADSFETVPESSCPCPGCQRMRQYANQGGPPPKPSDVKCVFSGVEVEIVNFELSDDDSSTVPQTSEAANVPEANSPIQKSETSLGTAANVSSRRSSRSRKGPPMVDYINTQEYEEESFQSLEIDTSDSNECLDKKSFSCPHCGKGFSSKYSRLRHEAIFHQKGQTRSLPHVCPVACCGKAFADKYNLALHGLSHSGARDFKCSDCGRGYSQRTHLERHYRRTHTNERPFPCTVCGFACKAKQDLSRHMLTHSGLKPFSCTACPRTFTQQGNLNSHIRRAHTKERPHKCSVCKASFTAKQGLAQHVQIHSGVSAFRCTDCGRGFAQQGNLNRHLLTHRSVRPFKCSVCEKRFTDLSNTKRHERNVHG